MSERVVHGVGPATDVGGNHWNGLAQAHCLFITKNEYATSDDVNHVSAGELILFGLLSLPRCPSQMLSLKKKASEGGIWGVWENWAYDAHIAIAEFAGVGAEILEYYRSISLLDPPSTDPEIPVRQEET